MTSIIELWQITSRASMIAAALCLFIHICGGLLAMFDDTVSLKTYDKWGWAGLVFFGLFMACEVGIIGIG